MATRELKATVFYNAGELTYNFPFDYIKKRFVYIKYVDNLEADNLDTADNLEYGVDYTINDKVVTLKEAGDTSKYIYIYRSTPTDPLVDFSDSSFLTEENLNLSNLQQLHLNEEMSDYLILHKVPSGTLEEIRDAVESTTSAAESAEQAAQEAINNAQSINIRTFANVNEMKANSTLTVGALCRTQGFYQSNDGGSADYIIINSNDDDNDINLIHLDIGLTAKLLVKCTMDIKQFGGVGDGIKDNTDIIQCAINILKGGKLIISNGVYLISDTIKVPNNIHIQGNSITGVHFTSIYDIEELKNLKVSYLYVNDTFKGDIAVIEPEANTKSFTISDLTLLGVNVPNSVYGYNITGDRGTVELINLNVIGMSSDGYRIIKNETALKGCTAMYNKGRGFSFYNCEDLDVELLRSGENSQEGFLLSNIDYSRFRVVDAWGNDSSGFNLQDVKRIFFTQIQSNENMKHGVQIGGSSDEVSFNQGRIAKNSTSSNNTYSDVVISVNTASNLKFYAIAFDGNSSSNKTKYAIESASDANYIGNLTDCFFSSNENFGTGILDSSINKKFNINDRVIIETTKTNDTVYNYIKYVLDNMNSALGNNIDIYFVITGVSISIFKGRKSITGEVFIQGAFLYKSKCYYVYGIKNSTIYNIYEMEMTKIEQ